MNFDKLKIGDKVSLGKYPTEADGTPQDILWQVIQMGDDVMLLSDKVLDIVAFNSTRTKMVEVIYDYHHFKTGYESVFDNDYLDSELRQFTKEFAQKAFSSDELDLFVANRVCGNDLVFVPSASELSASPLFQTAEHFEKQLTPFAQTKKMELDEDGKLESWWLRSIKYASSTIYADAVYRDRFGKQDVNAKTGFVPAIIVRKQK